MTMDEFDDLIGESTEPDEHVKRKVALELIAEGSNLSETARALGVNRSTLWRWRRDHPEFDRQVREAFVASVELLKREAERRAMSGSDKLLMFLLCNYAPDQFSQTQRLEHTVDESMAKRIADSRKRAGA
jgi:transposase-like protein